MPLSNGQLSLIHVAKSRLKLDDAAYREALSRVTGKRSAKDLEQAEFETVLAYFESLGFQRSKSFAHLGERPGMATPAQLRYIASLWRRYIGRNDEAALNHWLENKFGITNMRFASARTAQQAITALKNMVGRKHD